MRGIVQRAMCSHNKATASASAEAVAQFYLQTQRGFGFHLRTIFLRGLARTV